MPLATVNSGMIVGFIGMFLRVSLLAFLLPGLGEMAIPMQIRLVITFWISWLLFAMVQPVVPTEVHTSTMVLLFASEALNGFILGFGLRITIFVLQIAGTIIAQAMSLAQVLGGGFTEEPNTTISTLLILSGTTLAVTMGLHVRAIALLADSFEFLPYGKMPFLADTAEWATHQSMEAFAFALSLALPFVVLNFIYNLVLGVLNKAMPQLMVAFVGMPAITGAGIILLAMSVGGLLLIWLENFNDVFAGLGSV